MISTCSSQQEISSNHVTSSVPVSSNRREDKNFKVPHPPPYSASQLSKWMVKIKTSAQDSNPVRKCLNYSNVKFRPGALALEDNGGAKPSLVIKSCENNSRPPPVPRREDLQEQSLEHNKDIRDAFLKLDSNLDDLGKNG